MNYAGDITPEQSWTLLSEHPDAVLVDVRTPAEYEAGHLPGAALAPVDRIARDIVRLAPDKDTPITLYCRSGRRSEAARQTLLGMGYTRVTNAGGYEELKQKSATRP